MQIEQSEKINIIMKLSTVLKDVKNSRLIFFDTIHFFCIGATMVITEE